MRTLRTLPYSLFWAEPKYERTTPRKPQRGGFREPDPAVAQAEREVQSAAEEFAYQGKALEQQASAFLKANGAKVSRRGELWEKTQPEAWEKDAPQRGFPMPQGFAKAKGKLKGEP